MRTKYALVLILVLLSIAGGCSSFQHNKKMNWFSRDKPEIPDQVIGFWSSALNHPVSGPAERGFGGRVMFYKNGKRRPVKVDGTVVIYAYDESSRTPGDTRPDRAFVFQPDQLDKFHSESDLGHSYSFWLPWDEADGPRRDVSLIVRFQPTQGPMVMAQMTRHVLPGRETSNPTAVASNTSYRERPVEVPRDPIRPASFETEGGGRTQEDSRRMRTTTIHLPSRFGAGDAATTER